MLPDPGATLEIEPEQVARWANEQKDQRPVLIDCREADELEIASIAGHTWIQLRDIPDRLEAIRGEARHGVVVYCHHGVRSLHATEFLRARGITVSFSMRGGIDRWSLRIDPVVPRY